MDPLKVSAQFVAHVWFSEGKPDTAETRAQARRFAQDHWISFLPFAQEGLGRLLIRIGDRPKRRRKRMPSRRMPAPAVVEG